MRIRKKCFLKLSQNLQGKSLSNTVKSLQAVSPAVRIVTLLKKDPLTGVSELAVCRSSRK